MPTRALVVLRVRMLFLATAPFIKIPAGFGIQAGDRTTAIIEYGAPGIDVSKSRID